MPYVLALDQGTTSSRAIVFDAEGRRIAAAQAEFPQIYPVPGWVEHDPETLWRTQLATAREALALADVRPGELAAIGIANQRETTVAWDRRTGLPLHNAIVWQDRRTAGAVERLTAAGHGELLRARTGLPPDPYFSGTKIAWLLDEVPGLRARAARGEVAVGTVDSWLAYRLTGGRLHITDASNASRTLLYNLHTRRWDPELLDLLRVPANVLPEVRMSAEVYGEATVEGLAGVPLAALIGDQQAALAGQRCLRRGLAKNTYGTGCFMLMHAGAMPVASRHGLLTTVAWDIGGQVEYALEGSVFMGGAVVQWLRDGLGLIRTAAEVEALARQVPDSGGVYLVPAFAGLGAPHWDPYARGTLCGLTRGTKAAHLARAALEAIAFQVDDLFAAMTADAGVPIAELRVDGGAAANALLMQFQADLLQVPLVRPAMAEATAFGAALLAGRAVGLWPVEGPAVAAGGETHFLPMVPAAAMDARREGWRAAVQRAKGWVTA